MATHLTRAQAVVPVPAPKKYTPAKIVRGILGGLPLPVQNYTSAEMASAIRAPLEARSFDLVHLDSIHLCSIIPLIRSLAPNAKVVLDWHNIESELMARYARNAHSKLKALYARETARRLVHLEDKMLRDCSGHVVCSARERQELLHRNTQAHVAVIENGVDTRHFQPAPSTTVRMRVIFVGQMAYHANADAAVWFVNTIWPSVRERFPDLSLAIVGSDPTPAVRALAQRPGIEVTGTVPDVLPFYQDAFASVVPLQTGGGTRLKILEAMAAGAPVVSTALGAEGLQVNDGVHFLRADERAQSWIGAFEKLSDETMSSALIGEARALVCREYDWHIIGKRLATTYEEWLRAVH